MPEPLSLAHTVSKLPAQDLERARVFYRDKLGLKSTSLRNVALKSATMRAASYLRR